MKLGASMALSAILLVAAAAGPATAAPPSQRAANRIGIINFDYRPDPKTVAPGVTIKVANGDGIQNGIRHSLTADNGSFDTGIFTTGIRTITAPSQPGTYGYHCRVHGSMHGTLIVSG